MSARGLIIGAPRSGSGKTSVTIGLLRALRAARHRGARRQIRARTTSIPASTPRRPAGRASISTAGRCARRCSTALPARRPTAPIWWSIESAMGLFDGIPADHGRSGAAADLARLYRPAGAAGARRLRPVADGGGGRQGLCDLRSRRCAIAGVVLNRRRQRAAPAARRRGDRGDRPAGGRRDPARSDAGAARAPSRPGAGERACRTRGASSSGWPT